MIEAISGKIAFVMERQAFFANQSEDPRLKETLGSFADDIPNRRLRLPTEQDLAELARFVEDNPLVSGNDLVLTRNQDEQKPKQKKAGWEPILSEPDPENQRFIVTYSGPYAQRLEIHRERAERLIDVGALDGKIIITDLVEDRNRSISGVNPDGSVSARRNLFWGQKPTAETESEDQKYLVLSTPDGWRVEISGQRILEGFTKKKSKKSLDERFATSFNEALGTALINIFRREKLTSEKDKTFWNRVAIGLLPASVTIMSAVQIFSQVGFKYPEMQVQADLLTYIHYNWLVNGMAYLMKIYTGFERINGFLRPEMRETETFYEKFIGLLYAALPSVEIDRYLRGLMFLNFKGRNMVRLVPQER